MNSDTEKEITHDGDINNEDGELVFNPYNERNVEITESEITSILKRYGVPGKIKVHNIKLYQRAFIHKSYCKRPHLENVENNVTIVEKPDNCMRLRQKSNERLEFLGDGILECITKYYLYKRFPKENEGFMTEKKIALVKNESIGKMAYDMGLNKWYIISTNAEEKKTRTNLKKLGCLFEAFLGALFLDYNKINISDNDGWFDHLFTTGPGFQIAQIFVENIFEQHVNWVELLQTNENYKNILQVKLQKAFRVTPIYKEISAWDEDGGYHMGVYLCIGDKHYNFNNEDILNVSDLPKSSKNIIDNINTHLETTDKLLLFLGDSKHKIKKKAEQTACENSLNHFI